MNNERFMELREKCVYPVEDEYGNWVSYFFDEMKFAEFIVRECVQVSLKNSHRDDDMGAIIGRQMLKHFGVE